MLRENLDFLKAWLASVVIAITLAVLLVSVVGAVCYTGAYAISSATNKHPIQMRTTSNFNYPPLIIKIKTPDGKTLEATAEFEDETEQQQ